MAIDAMVNDTTAHAQKCEVCMTTIHYIDGSNNELTYNLNGC